MIELAVLLDAWTTTMWRACWQGSLVVLAVWSICRLIPSMPAKYQCWFWRLAVLKFVAVLLLPFAFDVPLLPAPAAAANDSNAPLTSSVPASEMEQVQSNQLRSDLPQIRIVLCVAWFIGVGWNLTRLMTDWCAVKRLRRRSQAIEYVPTLEQLAFCGRLFGLRANPELLEVTGCGSPMLIGILRPAIVVPSETLCRLDASEQAMVLGHELAHIRRADLLWTLVATLVRSVFFFHPLVWLNERWLVMAQEVAADELAVAQQHHDPVSYGKLLVSVVSKLGPSRVLPTMSMGTAGPMKSLTRRLSAMSVFGRESRRIVATSGLLLGAVVLLGLMPWKLVAAERQDGEKQAIQHLATIKISEGEKDKPKVVLSAPKIVFVPGPDAMIEIGDKARCIEVTVRSLPNEKPMKHMVEVKLIRDPKSKKPFILAAPKITLLDGTTGIVRMEGSAILEIEATVKAVK
jgi:beta-lactamase regulating signal transducer with metallopeptidase domain